MIFLFASCESRTGGIIREARDIQAAMEKETLSLRNRNLHSSIRDIILEKIDETDNLLARYEFKSDQDLLQLLKQLDPAEDALLNDAIFWKLDREINSYENPQVLGTILSKNDIADLNYKAYVVRSRGLAFCMCPAWTFRNAEEFEDILSDWKKYHYKKAIPVLEKTICWWGDEVCFGVSSKEVLAYLKNKQ
jgi:hypothetical protein